MTFSLLAALAFSALVIFWACSSAYTKPENRDYVPNINDKMFVRELFAHWVLFSSKRLSCSLLRLPLISSRQLLFICNSFLFFTKVIDDVESKGSEPIPSLHIWTQTSVIYSLCPRVLIICKFYLFLSYFSEVVEIM